MSIGLSLSIVGEQEIAHGFYLIVAHQHRCMTDPGEFDYPCTGSAPRHLFDGLLEEQIRLAAPNQQRGTRKALPHVPQVDVVDRSRERVRKRRIIFEFVMAVFIGDDRCLGQVSPLLVR